MKKNLPLYLRSLLLSGLFLLTGFGAFASHIVGMDLNYQWVSGNTYKITLVAYGDCASGAPFTSLATADPQICIYNAGTSVGTITLAVDAAASGTLASPVCAADTGLTTCSGGTIIGIKKYTYTGNYTVTGTSHYWRFIFDGNMGTATAAGRAASITNVVNPGNGLTVLVDTLDNTYHNNTSPVLSVVPTPYYCLNNADDYNPGASDPDGDSLHFYLTSGLQVGLTADNCAAAAAAGSVTYQTGITATTPLTTAAGSFAFNTLTGEISFNPNLAQRSLVVYNIREYRNDTFIGTSMREMTFLVQTCTNTPPNGGGGITGATGSGLVVDSVDYHICTNSGAFSFHVDPRESLSTANITITASGLPAGSTVTFTGNGTPTPDALFSWTSTGTAPGLYTFYLVYVDNNCPIAGQTTQAFNITINSLGAITGIDSICVGATTTLSEATTAGIWSTTDATATVGSLSGVVTGVASGTATISYSVGTCFVTKIVTIMPSPGPILGSSHVCIGQTITLSDTPTGGTWSALGTVLTVNSSGVVTGVTAGGTTYISYTLSDGCFSTVFDTVLSTPGTISGNLNVCPGGTTSLSDAAGGSGTWSSSVTTVATIDPSTGLVTGILAGTTTISFTAATGCVATAIVTVNNSVGPITPASQTICLGGTVSLTDATGGGTWSSSNTGVATVSGTGVTTGTGVGTATISYTSAGCSATTIVTVNTAPVAITPAGAAVCTGSTVNLTDATTGGGWTSSNGNASVSGTGVVTGNIAGTSTIYYALGTCSVSVTVTVNQSPGAINPLINTICLGGTVTLTDANAGGTWTSGNTGVATITGGGTVTGVGVGVSTITYSLSGCIAINEVTVNTAPVAITPATAITCVGSTVSLTDATAGGVWTSGNTAIATVGGTGIVTGTGSGIVTISYAVGTCAVTAVVSVNGAVGAINPAPATICLGGTLTLTDATTGGTWSSTNAGVATINAGGLVTSVGLGTTTISYVTPGCSVTAVVTVNNAPSAISPAVAAVCTGATVNLTDATLGGVWSASNGNANVGGTGIVTGVAAGTVTISYAIGTCVVTAEVTVNTGVAAISPTVLNMCIGNTATVSDAVAGGAWSSSNGNATVSAGGLVTAVASGTAAISYTLGSCTATIIANVAASPSAISPATATVCAGASITLSDAVAGGGWSTSNGNATAIAGVVTGVTAGTTTVSYIIGTCFATATVTVFPSPNAGTINAAATAICPGSSIQMTDSVAGGVWSASNGNATVDGTGLVTGITLGTDVISYTVTTGCGAVSATLTVTVSTTAGSGSILGPLTICVGSFDIYLDGTSGGTWGLTNGNAVISPVGVVTAITAGPETVVYTVPGACSSTTLNITIVPATLGAGAILGPTSICLGSSVTLSDPSAPGGVWTVTNGHATINGATGVVNTVSPGLDTVRYVLTTACGTYTATATMNVDASATPTAIGGPATVCVGGIIVLTDADLGGAWSSSNAHATVTPGVGDVTGVTPGIDTIKYTVTNGCGLGSTTKVITVMPTPGAGTITGAGTVCVGATIALTDLTTGGTWSATNGNAAVSAIGHVTGVTSGMDTILYTITAACGAISAEKVISVDAVGDAGIILGPDSLCVGTTITLLDFTTGGVWTAGNGNATVLGGVVTGVANGTVPISYTVSTACGSGSAVKIVNVMSPGGDPGIIVGINAVCVGSAITLTDTVAGGIWATSNDNAILLGPGIVSGVTPGIDSIFYVVTNMCGTNEARKIITINPSPVVPAITGPTSQCVGTNMTLVDGFAGGIWTSSDATVATVNLTTGIVTGTGAGIATLSYTVTNGFGCPGSAVSPDTVSTAVTVAAIMGNPSICFGGLSILSDTTAGGVWSSSDATIAAVDASGNVTGVGAGVATISYAVTGICNTATATMSVTVNALPAISPISGTGNVCLLGTATVSDATAGGVWSSSDTTILVIDPVTGVITGVTSGTANVIYTITSATGCSAATSVAFTVDTPPVVAAITGTPDECVGSSTTLFDATGGGTWSTGDVTIATVDASGKVGGVAVGVTTVIYTVTDGVGCTGSASVSDTVTTVPVSTPVTGTMSVCVGATTALSDAAIGGVWSSNDATLATVDPVTGIVTGVGAGSDYIFYTVTNACGSVIDSATVTVNAAPVVGPIFASFSSVCIGTAITLTDATAGGVWSSSDDTVATINSSGVVTGLMAGTVTMYYTVTSGGCTGVASYVLTVSSATMGVAVVPATATLCHGNNVNIHITAIVPGMTYQWLLNGNVIPGATNSGYIADTAGTYSLEVNNGTCSMTISGTIVSPQPDPVIGFNAPNVLYTGSFFAYQWYKNGVAISGANSSTYYETTPGDYTVVVTDINGCTDTSSAYLLGGGGGGTGVGSVANSGNIRIFPNPATSVLTIDAPMKVNVSLLSIDGKTLISQKDATTIDISTLADGMYLIMIYNENDVLLRTSKFVKAEQ